MNRIGQSCFDDAKALKGKCVNYLWGLFALCEVYGDVCLPIAALHAFLLLVLLVLLPLMEHELREPFWLSSCVFWWGLMTVAVGRLAPGRRFAAVAAR